MNAPEAGHRAAAPKRDIASSADSPLAVEHDRQQSIEAGMLTHFLRGTRFRQGVGATLMGMFVVFCWGHANSAALLTWLAAGLSILAFRQKSEVRYQRSGAFENARMRRDFVKTMLPIYGAHGAMWGGSLLFSFERLPLYDQLGCWLVLACAASAPLTTVALVPSLQKAYTNMLFALLVGVMVVVTTFENAAATDSPHYLLPALPLFFWWLLGRFGKGIHFNQGEQFGLQYDIALKEQEARAAVATKNRFLAAASHDMRQPVMALSLYAEHLVAYPEMHLELAPKIATASLAVKHLFESLFDLANLDSGKVVLHVQPVRVKDVLTGLGVQFGPLATAKNIELRVRGVDATVQTDSVRLQRMIGNVLGNAIKYSPPGTKILLAARAYAGRVRVEVWDQGFGIPPNDVDKVFQEFYRVDRADTPSIDGIGLGLSIVSRLSRVLNTQITISSVVGRGTRFTLCVSNVSARDTPASLDVG